MPRHKPVVYIVEALTINDEISGLQEGQILTSALKLFGINPVYRLIKDVRSIENALDELATYRVREEANIVHEGPFLHISAHGSQEGILTYDGSTYTWENLIERLERYNDLLRSRLVLCMSACFGIAWAKTKYESTSPLIRGIIGPTEEVFWDDSGVAFVTFYHRIIKGEDFWSTIQVMNAAGPGSSLESPFDSVPRPLAPGEFPRGEPYTDIGDRPANS